MQKINNDIKAGTFEKAYLLFGEEEYLCRHYKNKLRKAIAGEENEMNLSCFENAFDRVTEIMDLADTLPFFADRRLIIIENSSFFKKENPLTDYLSRIPDTTTLLFVENEVDKRTKMYKALKSVGYPCEFKRMSLEDLKKFVYKKVAEAEKVIRESTCEFFVTSIGDDMNMLANETDKLIAFVGGANEITAQHVKEICSMQIEGKIFDMVDALVSHDKVKAMSLYSDILALRENPFGVISLIRTNYNRLLSIMNLMKAGKSNSEIASATRVQEWLVKKSRNQLNGYSEERLIKAVETTVHTEERIKSGNIGDQMGLEIMLANLLTI